ncbi:cytochrome P450 monooxygenase 11 [Polyrhizophydium stewartii]|uniref:Peptidyl-prolyl cis-trans isomerase n=1 Tax=Polyrhizophydium stewartii TaxID=2732419 RepID=A0ABR4N449_9FUNG
MVNPRVFLDIDIDGRRAGRMVFELFADRVPKTANNFRALCTGEFGRSATGAHLSYKGSRFHRIIKGFMIQGGDFTKGDGTGGESIYGGAFEDEDLTTRHLDECLLSMANRGPNTNGSQFFVTSKALPHLDGKHVVFGRLVSGKDLFRRIENVPTDQRDRPHDVVVIANCGELERVEVAGSAAAAAPSASEGDIPISLVVIVVVVVFLLLFFAIAIVQIQLRVAQQQRV